jgi:hypothetical protein
MEANSVGEAQIKKPQVEICNVKVHNNQVNKNKPHTAKIINNSFSIFLHFLVIKAQHH